MGSIAIVVLISAFLGMALSLQIIDQLSFVGMQMYTGQLIAYSIINEIGPVFIAIIFAGRVGGGSASELGSMGLNQQLDALRVYGVDPLKKLVAPRLVASIVILPALTVIGDLTALIGGAFMAVFINEQSPAVYWNQVGRVLTPRWIAPGVLKPMAFGSCIALVSCYKGLTVSGGALGLRRATTGAFVQSALLIIALDFVITKLVLMTLGRA
jgi:phospholipid/cholesterol/gamma-HCH transport system permease protein